MSNYLRPIKNPAACGMHRAGSKFRFVEEFTLLRLSRLQLALHRHLYQGP